MFCFNIALKIVSVAVMLHLCNVCFKNSSTFVCIKDLIHLTNFAHSVNLYLEKKIAFVHQITVVLGC